MAGLLGVHNVPDITAACDRARVADLTAHFGVKGRGIENDTELAFQVDDLRDLAADFERIEAEKFGGFSSFDMSNGNNFFLLRGASAFALLFHALLKANRIHRHS